MIKSKRNKKCVYCSQSADSSDHIPSKCLFSDSTDKQLITVPTCTQCNQKYKKDEEYFRNFIAALAVEKSPEATKLFFGKIRRCIEERPDKIGKKMSDKTELIDLFNKNGLYLGERTKIVFTEEDSERFFNIMDKNIKGLSIMNLKRFCRIITIYGMIMEEKRSLMRSLKRSKDGS